MVSGAERGVVVVVARSAGGSGAVVEPVVTETFLSPLKGFNVDKEKEDSRSGLNQTNAVATARIITIINNTRFNLLKLLISFHQDIGKHSHSDINIIGIIASGIKFQISNIYNSGKIF